MDTVLAFGPAVLIPVWIGNMQLKGLSALFCGLFSVILGQLGVLAYHFRRQDNARPIQSGKLTRYDWSTSARQHMMRPEGLCMLATYLTVTWFSGAMPASYYQGGLSWRTVVAQLLLTDALQFGVHRLQHIFRYVFRASHRAHHRVLNPCIFDAFNGSIADTCLMVLLPLSMTSQCIEANLASYIAFGSLYAVGLTLIHSETHHPWDLAFTSMGISTPADHHVHHLLQTYNYGHLVTWWDRACDTYKPPSDIFVDD
jgi:sterol desaturase/sphingolipid hydroxylase (fatty acid hydroxylase superfamily)